MSALTDELFWSMRLIRLNWDFRSAAPGAGYRNGYRTGRLKTAEGMIEYAAPQISDRAVPFRSRLREIIRGRSEELEALAVEMYARGLSTRDIEALFADERGQSLLSRTAVSEITQRLWAEYEAFASRDLSEFEVIYLFVDGIAERLHLGQPREAGRTRAARTIFATV
jgi:putative transposase